MKILFLTQNLIMGGVEKQLFRTLNYLTENYDVQTSIGIDDFNTEFVKDFFLKNTCIKYNLLKIPYIPLPDITIYNYPIRKFLKVKRFCQLKKFFKNAFAQYDVIIDYKNASYLKWLELFNDKYNQNREVKVITIFHGSYYFHKKQVGDRWLKIFKNYDHIICWTNNFKKQFDNDFSLYCRKCITVYNSIDVETIVARSKENIAIKLPQKYICSISRLGNDKDIETLIKAFAQVYKKHAELKLIIVGDGPSKSRLIKLAESYNADSGIIFIGTLSNPYPVLKKSELLVLSSKGEGFGLVLIEALSLKVPVVSSDCLDGPPEILNNGEFGLLFKAGDYLDLANKLDYAIFHEKEMENMALKGHASLSRFSFARNTKDLLKCLTRDDFS